MKRDLFIITSGLLILDSFVVSINPTIIPIVCLVLLFTAFWAHLCFRYVPNKILNKIPNPALNTSLFMVGIRSSLFILSFTVLPHPIIINFTIDCCSILISAIIVYYVLRPHKNP